LSITEQETRLTLHEHDDHDYDYDDDDDGYHFMHLKTTICEATIVGNEQWPNGLYQT
jgi:hypothetical protein